MLTCNAPPRDGAGQGSLGDVPRHAIPPAWRPFRSDACYSVPQTHCAYRRDSGHSSRRKCPTASETAPNRHDSPPSLAAEAPRPCGRTWCSAPIGGADRSHLGGFIAFGRGDMLGGLHACGWIMDRGGRRPTGRLATERHHGHRRRCAACLAGGGARFRRAEGCGVIEGRLRLRPSSGRWAIFRPGERPIEITSGEVFYLEVNGQLRLTRMEFRHFGELLKGRHLSLRGEYYTSDGHPLRNGARAALGHE
jgi:hypothetical protein